LTRVGTDVHDEVDREAAEDPQAPTDWRGSARVPNKVNPC